MGIKVLFGSKIANELQYFPEKDLLKIWQFKEHLETYGFEHLAGRNKPSDEVPKDDPYWSKKVAIAQQYHLWHYHIGIPGYDKSKGFGNYTSEYILHYIKGDGFIKIVDFTAHPPFKLPSERYLED
ncbi:hypothetical protein A4G20_06945 [Pasteurellaceae bacterium RH1A]|nr:hypothetical protein A4G20_06945 [Pasteurellaceae bacterium RH1A]